MKFQLVAAILCAFVVAVRSLKITVAVDRPQAIAGDNVRITCTLEGADPYALLYWYKEVITPGKATVEMISTNTNLQLPYSKYAGRYKPGLGEDGGNRVFYLDLQGVTKAETGNYQCVSSDDKNEIGQATLDVYSPVTEISLSNGTNLANGTVISLVEGEKFNITCSANGSIPAPHLMIAVGDRDITSEFHMDTEMYLICGESQLTGKTCIIHTLHARTAVHVGGFQPRYEDDGHSILCAGAITEAQLPAMMTSAVIDLQFAPKISCQLMSNYALHATNVRIECTLEAKPGLSKDDVIWSWMHGDQPIQLVAGETFEDISARLKHKTGNIYLATLEFTQLKERHFDPLYMINATNAIGSVQKNVKLTMKEIEVESTTTPKSGESISEAATPSWSSFLIALTIAYVCVILTKC